MSSALADSPSWPSWGCNFGGGVNSTALLLMLHDRGLRPDWVLFADTGSERPETYEHIERVREWCSGAGYPFDVVRWIRRTGEFESVHDNCLRTSYLPSKAYGYSGCTYKWKIQPMDKWRKAHGFAESVVAIGYDASERRRVARVRAACSDPEQHESLRHVWYPLIAWGIDRAACEERIARQGWECVKSSCFLCPHMSAEEWCSLQSSHPGLYRTAVLVESRARACGHAERASIFKRATGACICRADVPHDGEGG